MRNRNITYAFRDRKFKKKKNKSHILKMSKFHEATINDDWP